MFWNRKKKTKRGFVLIYALFIGLICMLVSMVCYKMEILIRSDNLNDYNETFQIEDIQKHREVLLTKLNSYINENIEYDDDKDINEYFLSLIDFRIYYGKSYIYYDRDNDIFKLQYILDNKPYKGESYEYKIKNGEIKYSCIDYSY